MDKKLLYVGGGHADIPIIKAAKELGYYVITTGNKPDDLGHVYGDQYCYADFSNCEAIYQLAKEQKVTAICASCNDFAALSAAYAAQKLGLPGHDNFETSQKIHHKDQFRRFLIENGINCPYGKGYTSLESIENDKENWQWPVIVKPIDLTGGKGIKIAFTHEELKSVAQQAFGISKARRIIVEEFIQGTRHGFSAFIYKGKVCFYFCDNEHYFKNPYMVSGASYPSTVPNNIQKELCLIIEKITKKLVLVDGIFHMQFIMKDNKPYIIEVCRRAPGDLYIELVRYATDIDYAKWILKACVGDDCSGLEMKNKTCYYTRHCVMAEHEGVIQDITFDNEIKDNIVKKVIWGKAGDVIENSLTYKAGIVFVEYESQEEMQKKVDRLEEMIKIHIKGE